MKIEMKQKLIYFFLMVLSMGLLSCNKDKDNQSEIDRMKILEYLDAKQIQAQEDPSGIFYRIIEEGTGDFPLPTSLVSFKFRGYLLNGTVFEQTTGDEVAEYTLNGLILGLQYGIAKLKEGGKGQFFLPSALAFGSQDLGNVPPNSVLIFDVELIKIDNRPQEEIDRDKILSYLESNMIENAKEDPSGVFYQILEAGDGTHPTASSTVVVKYKGYLLDGTVFDQTSGDQTVSFQLTNLIEGWKYGVPHLEKGGKGRLFIPSGLGYGSQPTASIPANSVLIFDIDLVDFY